jgi:hypothetical protein
MEHVFFQCLKLQLETKQWKKFKVQDTSTLLLFVGSTTYKGWGQFLCNIVTMVENWVSEGFFSLFFLPLLVGTWDKAEFVVFQPNSLGDY